MKIIVIAARADDKVYEIAVARSGEGKSGGYRVIVFFRSEERTFFIYGFAKSAKDNINQGELRAFKHRARDVFSLTDEQIRDRMQKGTLIEVFRRPTGHEI